MGNDFLGTAEALAGALAVIEGPDVALIIVDAGLRIVTWPSAAERLTGLSSAEAIGREALLLLAGNRDESHDSRSLLDSIRSEGRAVSTSRITRKGRGDFWGEIRMATLKYRDDKPPGYLLQMRDLRAGEDFAPQLQRLRMLEDALQDAGGVAHDLNNLLTVLLSEGRGNARAGAAVPFEANAASSKVADRIAALLQSFMDVLRGVRRRPVALNINDIVSGVVRTLGLTVRKDMETIVNLHPALSTVNADALEVEEVLLNLVANARYANPTGAPLLIETSNVHVAQPITRNRQALQMGDYARVAVRDAGSGMGREALAHLFEPFYTTKGAGQGTGLGLSNALRIVSRLGGTILIESSEGCGTLAEVYLPTAAPLPSNPGHN